MRLQSDNQRNGDCDRNVRTFQCRASALPLPGGEGWGEGERSKLQPQADSRNCQASRVLRLSRGFPKLLIFSCVKC
jgi:hypothetical protein